MTEKEKQLAALASDMLKRSHDDAIKNIQKVLKSGAIDLESWDGSMVLPKTIVTALLEEESTQWVVTGTSYAKQVKRDVRNIRIFL